MRLFLLTSLSLSLLASPVDAALWKLIRCGGWGKLPKDEDEECDDTRSARRKMLTNKPSRPQQGGGGSSKQAEESGAATSSTAGGVDVVATSHDRRLDAETGRERGGFLALHDAKLALDTESTSRGPQSASTRANEDVTSRSPNISSASQRSDNEMAGCPAEEEGGANGGCASSSAGQPASASWSATSWELLQASGPSRSPTAERAERSPTVSTGTNSRPLGEEWRRVGSSSDQTALRSADSMLRREVFPRSSHQFVPFQVAKTNPFHPENHVQALEQASTPSVAASTSTRSTNPFAGPPVAPPAGVDRPRMRTGVIPGVYPSASRGVVSNRSLLSEESPSQSAPQTKPRSWNGAPNNSWFARH